MKSSIHAKFKNLSNRLRRFHGSLLSRFRLFYLFTQFLRRHFFNLYRDFIRFDFHSFGQFMAILPTKNCPFSHLNKVQSTADPRPISVNHIFPIPSQHPDLLQRFGQLHLSHHLQRTASQAAHKSKILQSVCQHFTKRLQFITRLYFQSFINSFNFYFYVNHTKPSNR